MKLIVIWAGKHASAMLIIGILSIFILSPMTFLPSALADNNTITARNGQLYLGGHPYLFTGVNAYELATDHSMNWGCGGMLTDSDMDSFFANLRSNSLVRFWAFQDLAINKRTNIRDWTGIDRVFASAEKYHQRLLVVIGNHWNACDGGGQKNDAWYQGGYMQPFSPDGYQYRVAYYTYMQELVSRYKTSSALGMWELINEPELQCGGNVQTLRTFFDTVGAKLKSIDPNHLLEMGVAGRNQCGVVGSDYSTLLGSSAIDVADYHDYNVENQAMPDASDPSGLPSRIHEAEAAKKPIIVSESGIHGSNTAAGCTYTLATRASGFKAKMDAAFSAGVSGYMPWNWQLSSGGCTFDITPSDPLMTQLSSYNLASLMNAPISNPASSGAPATVPSSPATPIPSLQTITKPPVSLATSTPNQGQVPTVAKAGRTSNEAAVRVLLYVAIAIYAINGLLAVIGTISSLRPPFL